LPETEAGLASGLNNASFQIGGAVAALGVVAASLLLGRRREPVPAP